jgi:hypothetical protein
MLESIKVKEEFLHYDKLSENHKLLEKIKFFNNELLDKTVFIFFLLFDKPLFYVNQKKKYQGEINIFKEMTELLYYVFYTKKPKNVKNKPKIDYKQVEKIMEHRNEYGLIYYSNLYNTNINTFEEAEFLSFCFYMTHVLYNMCGYKEDSKHEYVLDKETKMKSTLKERFVHLLNTYKFQFNKKDVESLFKQTSMGNFSILNHFYGRFESGLKNIFKGCIPKNLSEKQLYQYIKDLNEEIVI